MKNISALSTSCAIQHESILSLLNHWTIEKKLNTKLFTSEFDLVIPNKQFCILPIYEAKYSFDNLIVWDILSLELSIRFPNTNKIIYLHNDNLPWMSNKNILYDAWAALFENKKVTVLTTDKKIRDIYRLTWNTGTFVESFLNEEVYEYLW